ncbi:MAG: hypothetical protein LC670_00790 [Flavobacteriales bacterium]|nr:hypothetical protein [Flavobacteriales bacterium]
MIYKERLKDEDNAIESFLRVSTEYDTSATEIKELMAQFNTEYFKSANLRVTNSFIDKSHQIVIVRSFSNKEAAMDYYSTFTKNKSLVKELVEKKYPTFTITTKNFTVLFRNKNPDVYTVFFNENYL